MFKDEIEKLADSITETMDNCGDYHSVEELKKFALQHAEERQALKVVDLSVLIESGIDCEFGPCEVIDKLEKIHFRDDGYPYKGTKDAGFFDMCQPRKNHLHAWKGASGCPLPEGVKAVAYTRGNGSYHMKGQSSLVAKWKHQGLGCDIIAFEVTGLIDGYTWS